MRREADADILQVVKRAAQVRELLGGRPRSLGEHDVRALDVAVCKRAIPLRFAFDRVVDLAKRSELTVDDVR